MVKISVFIEGGTYEVWDICVRMVINVVMVQRM